MEQRSTVREIIAGGKFCVRARNGQIYETWYWVDDTKNFVVKVEVDRLTMGNPFLRNKVERTIRIMNITISIGGVISKHDSTYGNDIRLQMAEISAEDPETLVYEFTKELKKRLKAVMKGKKDRAKSAKELQRAEKKAKKKEEKAAKKLLKTESKAVENVQQKSLLDALDRKEYRRILPWVTIVGLLFYFYILKHC